MQLSTFETDTQTVRAGYTCPCGELARSHCCRGNEFVVGPSVHPEPAGHHGHHEHGHSDQDVDDDAAIHPVCGMHVDRDGAVTKGLHPQHAGTDHYFCAKGCYLDFGDDPERYLDPSYIPSM